MQALANGFRLCIAKWSAVQICTSQTSITRAMSDLADCCKPSAEWKGTPSGQDGKLGDVPAYLTSNWSSSKAPIIVLVPDVSGFVNKNLRLVADRYASEGSFRVACPDFMDGDFLTPGGPQDVLQAWFKRHDPEASMPLCNTVLKECAGQATGWQGFCWGAKQCILLAGQPGKIGAAVVNHPSRLTTEDVEAVRTPALFQFSGPTDKQVPPEKLKEYLGIIATKPDCGSHHFAEQLHGWSLKGDVEDASIAAGAEAAWQNSFSFFKQHLR